MMVPRTQPSASSGQADQPAQARPSLADMLMAAAWEKNLQGQLGRQPSKGPTVGQLKDLEAGMEFRTTGFEGKLRPEGPGEDIEGSARYQLNKKARDI